MFGNEAIVSQLRLMRYDVISHNAQKEILLKVVTVWKMTGKRATKTTQIILVKPLQHVFATSWRFTGWYDRVFVFPYQTNTTVNVQQYSSALNDQNMNK